MGNSNPAYTKEPWRVGNYHCCVVSDTPIDGVDSESSVEYYGGHCICESCTDANADRIVACVNACAGITTDALESGLIKHLLDDAYMITLNPFDPKQQNKQDMTYLGKPVYEEGSNGKD